MKKAIIGTDKHHNMPEWYWARGLHDAQILQKQYIDRFESGISHRITNCLELVIDSKQAMFDMSVKIIRFYNYKELTPKVNIVDAWWISDKLTYCNGKYVLEVNMRSRSHFMLYCIRFEHCEVIR